MHGEIAISELIGLDVAKIDLVGQPTTVYELTDCPGDRAGLGVPEDVAAHGHTRGATAQRSTWSVPSPRACSCRAPRRPGSGSGTGR